MNQPIVQWQCGITLVGGGPVPARDLALALRRAPVIVAADGGADRVLAAGLMPEAVIGDFDSISDQALAAIPADRQHRLPEQETTDFDKALRSVGAPFVIGLGFAGARMDHTLSIFNALVRRAGTVPPCIILGASDLVFAAPPDLHLRLRIGDRLSLFPMSAIGAESQGLEWPLAGLAFAPDGRDGASNRVTAPDVRLRFDRKGMLVILPRARLDAAIAALAGPAVRR